MHRLLTTLRRGFKEKIGWKRLGIAASVLIIVFALTTLVQTLKGVDSSIILTALTEIAPYRMIQCRCGPVTRPVAPTAPTRTPASTVCPGFTSMRERWK